MVSARSTSKHAGAEVKADATDEAEMVAEEEGRGGGMWCWLRRAAMAADEEACGALPAAVEEEGSGSHLSCFPKYIFYRVTKTLRRQ